MSNINKIVFTFVFSYNLILTLKLLIFQENKNIFEQMDLVTVGWKVLSSI